MWRNNDADICRYLTEAHDFAIRECNHNRDAAKQKLQEFIRKDRRLDNMNANQLADAVERHRYNGSVIDLDALRLAP